MVGRKRIGNELVVATKKARKLVVVDISNNVMKAQEKNPNSSGALAIINEAILVYPWLTKDIIYGHIRRSKVNTMRQASMIAIVNANVSDIVPYTNNNGGRPKGTRVKSKINIEAKKELARNEIAKLCSQAKNDNYGRLARHKYKEIHDTVLETIGINDGFSVPFRLIQSRLRRNKLVVLSTDTYSPLAPVEPVIMQIVVWKQEAGQPITLQQKALLLLTLSLTENQSRMNLSLSNG